MMRLPVIFAASPDLVADPLYPDSDGEPMGETDYHITALIYLREALKARYRKRRDIYIAADMFLYYEEGDPAARKAPDVMVVKGVRKYARRSFKTWVEGAIPCVIIELISAKTWKEDLEEKPLLFARLGVTEYFLFDPEGENLIPPLQGYRRKGKRFVPLVPAADGSLVSQQLGLRLVPERELPRLVDLKTNQPLLTTDELLVQAEETARRAEAAEAELKRLRALIEKKKGKRS
jgi:Uma2 family endonuclease